MKVRVVYSVWGADGFDRPLAGGDHELEDVTAEQARSIAGAAAAGVVEVLDATDAERALLEGHVESQEDGEAAQAAAMGEWIDDVRDDDGILVEPGRWSGGWTHGNLTNFVAVQKDRLAYDDQVNAGTARSSDKPLTKGERAEIERQVRIAEATLSNLTEPS